jgi:hypothetical protein
MLKLIAILVLAGNLNVAVETDAGWAEKSFQNTEEGALEVLSFANKTVGDTPIRVVVGSLDDKDDANEKHLSAVLSEYEIKHGRVSPQDVRSAAGKNKLPETSAVAVGLADIARFGFLYGRK